MTCVAVFTPWPARTGRGPHEPSCERYWLPRVGPAAWLLWCLLVDELGDGTDPVAVDLVDAARRLGIAGSAGTSRIGRALRRLERFGLVAADDAGWTVRTAARVPDGTGSAAPAASS